MKNEELTGKVYDIQPFSVQDGPGIRTTVFLKGCPLRCPWCHSPESQLFETELCWMESRCVGTELCGECIKACPRGVISEGSLIESPDGGKKHIIRRELSKCIGCGVCARACTSQALYFCGTDYSVDEIVKKVVRDKTFFDHSGGGVTVSGGECLCQPEFTLEILRRFKAEGLHTAVDTTGFVKSEIVERVIPYTDLFLYDLKHMDSEKHRQVVGVPNELILDNARLIAERGGKMQVRIPLIPGFNADEENLRATARFCADVREAVTVVQILPYHKFGTVKWDRLSRRPPVFDAEVPTEAEVDAAKAIFESFGLPVTIH
jgi:pyruvate formate lyase activating enzyme